MARPNSRTYYINNHLHLVANKSLSVFAKSARWRLGQLQLATQFPRTMKNLPYYLARPDDRLKHPHGGKLGLYYLTFGPSPGQFVPGLLLFWWGVKESKNPLPRDNSPLQNFIGTLYAVESGWAELT